METKPKTNADRIREMSDEELAKKLSPGNCPPGIVSYEHCGHIKCEKCWLSYLRSPVEESEESHE